MRSVALVLLGAILCCLALGGLLVAVSMSSGGKLVPMPSPVKPTQPRPLRPCPGPGPCPHDGAGSAAFVTKDMCAPDGTCIQCQLPHKFHLRNKGGSDGAGLCVFCSIQHTAEWNWVKELVDFFPWMQKYPGGGYPEKVDRMIAKKCKEMNVEPPKYIQVEGHDLEILKLACRCGRMPGVTYSYSPTGRYGGKIAHMVSLMAAGVGQGPDGKGWWVILDNNFPGTYEWMSEKQFKDAYTAKGRENGWAWISLNPAPSPLPRK